MNCAICGSTGAGEQHLDRRLVVFCCAECLPLVRDVFDHYEEHGEDAEPTRTAS